MNHISATTRVKPVASGFTNPDHETAADAREHLEDLELLRRAEADGYLTHHELARFGGELLGEALGLLPEIERNRVVLPLMAAVRSKLAYLESCHRNRLNAALRRGNAA